MNSLMNFLLIFLLPSVCLSTVDRRSRERFIESNNQISALVEKFKVEGGPYRKYAGPNINMDNMENHQKIPLTAYGRPGFLTVLMYLIQRSWTQLNLFRWEGFKTLFLKLLLMPSFFFLLWIFYFDAFQDVRDDFFIIHHFFIAFLATIPKNICESQWPDIQCAGGGLLYGHHLNLHNM